MTGMTKFSKVSVFSKLHNLHDITMSEAFEKHFVSSLSERDLGIVTSGIHNEVHFNNGRIDTIIVNRDNIYIFEFKMDQPAKVAIDQIKEKGYAIPYLSDGKPITLIGINFSKKKRNIVEWLEEEMA